MEEANGTEDPTQNWSPQQLLGSSQSVWGSGMLMSKSFASVGMRDEKGWSLVWLLHTSGTDMEPILQTIARVPLPLGDFSKPRLPMADLQRFLKQRGDSREATNYVDEEPDSKQCLFSL